MKKLFAMFVLSLALVLPGGAMAQDAAGTIEWLESVASLCEKQGYSPVPCEQIRQMFQRAQQELANEKQKWNEASKNPPKKENATGGITPGWAKYMNDWKKKIDSLERRLKAVEERLRKCGCLQPEPGPPIPNPGIPFPPDKPPVKPSKPPIGPDVPTYDPRFPKPGTPKGDQRGSELQDDHSGCDKPNRFECGQHYQWWLKNHEHKPAGGKKQDEKQGHLPKQAESFFDVYPEMVPLPLTGNGQTQNGPALNRDRPSTYSEIKKKGLDEKKIDPGPKPGYQQRLQALEERRQMFPPENRTIPTYDPRFYDYKDGKLVPKR